MLTEVSSASHPARSWPSYGVDVPSELPGQPRVVVERYVAEVLNAGVAGALEWLVTDPSLRQRVVAMRSAFPDLEVSTEVLLTEGDLVAGHFTGGGTHRGPFNGIPPTGRRWDARCTAIYRVAAGQIVEAWVNWDHLALMEQLGAIERVRTVSA